jgi:hypothetical protein
MRIFDSYHRGCVEHWGKEHDLSKVIIGYPPSFHLHLKDSHAHVDMIDILKGRYRAEECRFRTHLRIARGLRSPGQSRCGREDRAADTLRDDLNNADVRQDLRYMTE